VSTRLVQFVLNGGSVDLEIETDHRAIDVIRDLGWTGTKEGCGIGVCGLCTVLVDDQPISACLLPGVLLDGSSVTTVEGLAADGELSSLQESFIRNGGFQCGICTPGQLVMATALLRLTPQPSREEILEWMMGNLCRCTGYEGIVAAIAEVATLSAIER
jgi:carbon-monoxide dehydrogenase small subunit